jgi:hypothetical protein
MIKTKTPIKTRWRPDILTGAAAVLSLAAGCDVPPGSDIGVTSAPLNGALLTNSNLTRKNVAVTGEIDRRNDSNFYYNQTGLGSNGSTGPGTVGANMKRLSDFLARYGFGSNEAKAYYYNRGDLGIGREMHCVDRMAIDGQIACYVKNFFGGDGSTEFGFGMSSNIAFDNMDAGNAFATVAMVYRRDAPAKDRVYFVVYDGNGVISSTAALDRHGLNYLLEFQKNGRTPDPAVFGANGVNFNNHIPTNCINCHGGKYDPATNSVTEALFLPFDLDQFEFQDAAGKRRTEQLDAFARLNSMVRKVALGSGAPQIADQIDGWHSNLATGSEVLRPVFNSGYVPIGWTQTASDTALYKSVIRPYCRNCHVANSPNFSTEAEFFRHALKSYSNVCGYQMPHALQTVREFWLSSAPDAFESWYRTNVSSGLADDFRSFCGPGTVVTLDPQFLASTVVP